MTKKQGVCVHNNASQNKFAVHEGDSTPIISNTTTSREILMQKNAYSNLGLPLESSEQSPGVFSLQPRSLEVFEQPTPPIGNGVSDYLTPKFFKIGLSNEQSTLPIGKNEYFEFFVRGEEPKVENPFDLGAFFETGNSAEKDLLTDRVKQPSIETKTKKTENLKHKRSLKL